MNNPIRHHRRRRFILLFVAACLACARGGLARNRLGRFACQNYAPAWGPEEEWIYYIQQVRLVNRLTYEDDFRTYFRRIRPDGTDDTEIFQLWPELGRTFIGGLLTDNATLDIHPGCRRAVLCVGQTSPVGMFTFDLDGGNFQRVRPLEHWQEGARRSYYALYGNWSPDGQWIVFEEERPNKGGYQIAKVREDGTGYQVLYPRDPESKFSGIRPEWNPRTNHILFTRSTKHLWRATEPDAMMMIRPNGNEALTITNSGGLGIWSPHGELILFNGSRILERDTRRIDCGWDMFSLSGNGYVSASAQWGFSGWIWSQDSDIYYVPLIGDKRLIISEQRFSVPTRQLHDPSLRIGRSERRQ